MATGHTEASRKHETTIPATQATDHFIAADETLSHRKGRAMQFSRVLSVVDCHAEGESGKVIVGGIGQIPGETMFDKREFLRAERDDIRRLVLLEPRRGLAQRQHSPAVPPPGRRHGVRDP